MNTLKSLDKTAALKVGALQGLLVVLYVAIFVSLVQLLDAMPEDTAPALAGMFFLLAFVTSALICGSLVLGYPAIVAIGGNIKRAVQIVFYTAITMIFCAVVSLFAILIVGQ